jgi:predicted acetyltransferase
VRQVEPQEFGRIAPAVFEAARRLRPGQIDRDAGWWNRALGLDGHEAVRALPHNLFVHDGEHGPDGLLGWSSDGQFGLMPPMATIDVRDLVSASDSAYRDLWSYLAGIDLAEQVRLPNRPVDEQVRWLLDDGRTLELREHVDFLWLRILDVEATLPARRYATPGELVLEVVDDAVAAFAGGRYLLAADGELVQCERTERPADLELSQRALAAAYLGGFGLHELAIAGTVREHRPGALARATAMFSVPLAPWNATWF